MNLKRLVKIGSAGLLAGAVTATVYVNSLAPNLVENGSFEAGFHGENGGAVPNGWHDFYCDTPYTPAKCPALRRDTVNPPRPGNNPPDLLMGTPEWKDTSLPERTRSGHASQLFSANRAHDAGDFQTIATVPGQVCTFTAYVMTWAANGDRGTDGKLWTSDTATADDRDNAVWRLGVANGRAVYAFGPDVKWSRKWTYEDGHYDRFIPISYIFVAGATETTIYIRQTMLWPLSHNEGYIDDVSVQCVDQVTPTPVTPQPPTPTGAPTGTPEACVMVIPACNPVRIVTATPIH